MSALTPNATAAVQALFEGLQPRGVTLDFDGLSAVPLDLANVMGPNVLHASEAMVQGLIAVEELEPPVVPTLRVTNNADVPVFFSAGAVLKGGAQTRIVATPILVIAGAAGLVDVRCVEAGRWNTATGKHFTGMTASPLALKSAKHRRDSTARLRHRARAADQEETWGEISTILMCRGIQSESSSLVDALDERAERTLIARRALAPEDLSRSEAALKGAGGLAVIHSNGELASLDLFSSALADAGVQMALASIEAETGSVGRPMRSDAGAIGAQLAPFLASLSAATTWVERDQAETTLVDFNTPDAAQGTAFLYQNTLLQVSITFA